MKTREKLRKNGIFLNYDDDVTICKKYYINELSIFSSSIRDGFNNNSDIDILVLNLEMEYIKNISTRIIKRN